MKQTFLALFFLSYASLSIKAQDKPPKNYRNFPLVLSMQFHSLSLPFKDVKSNFSNVGFGLGTEISLGSTHAWAQQFNFIYYRNKNAGNGIGFYTQSSWRQRLHGIFIPKRKLVLVLCIHSDL